MEARLKRKHYLIIAACGLLIVAGVVNRETLAERVDLVTTSLTLRSAEAKAKNAGLVMPSDENRTDDIAGLIPFEEFDRILRLDRQTLTLVAANHDPSAVYRAIAQNTELTDALKAALKAEGDIFDYPFSDGMDVGEPNFGPMKNAVKIAVSQAAHATRTKDYESAREYYESIFSLANRLASDPGFSSLTAWNAIQMTVLKQIISDLSANAGDKQYVAMVSDLLQSKSFDYDFEEVCRRYMMRHIQTAREFFSLDPDSQITFFSAEIEYVAPPKGAFVEGALLSRTLKHWAESVSILEDKSRTSFERGVAIDQKGYNWAQSDRRSDYMGKTFPYVFSHAALSIERIRQLRNVALVLADAIEFRQQNGRLPKSDELSSDFLINTILGEPMSYTANGNQIIIKPIPDLGDRYVTGYQAGLAWVQATGYTLDLKLE